MPPKDVGGVGGWFLGDMRQAHVNLLHPAPALAMIARRASRHQIRPVVLSAHVTRDDVVNRQRDVTPAAILTGIIVPPEYFAAR